MSGGITRSPAELALERLFNLAGVNFTRPEIDHTDPANLDFRIPEIGVYIELKGRNPRRLAKQIRRTRRETTILCLIGPNAPADLVRLAAMLAPAAGGEP